MAGDTGSVLGLELRGRRFGYAFFDRAKLVDYGTRHFVAKRSRIALAVRRLNETLQLLSPAVIAIREGNEPDRRHRTIIKAIRAAARWHGVVVKIVSNQSIQKSFERDGRTTKWKIASAVAQLFPDLAWRLPAQRKLGDAEHHRMILFDAAAAGLAYTWSVELVADHH